MWKTYKLSDIGTVVGGATPSTTVERFYGGDIPWLTPKDLSNFQDRYIERGERNITQEGLNSCSAHLLPENSVLFSSRAPIGYVAIAKNPIATNQGFKSIIPNANVDSLFLYYALKYNKEKIEAMGSGTTFKEVSGAIMKNFEISLPPLEEQRRIAGILGAIDDKIENNRRINTNLELQAQALYKQWFVDNRKDDWEEKQLGEIALHITDGVHNTVIDSPNGEYYLLSCKNIKSGQLFIGSNERRIDHETFTKLRKRTRLSHGDILVTSVGTVGEMYLVNESPSNYEFQRSVAIIKPNNDIISSYFLYAALLYQQNEIKHLAHGAVQQCIFISDLKEYSLIVPNKDDISAFDAVVAPMFNKIGELQKENETLAILRDTLLPKLMNGEIKVAE
ncbi:MAG: restriction endonuclease subunit S [Paludibacteraceae bacterium]|nr:restriction endonuclease subunit S [Paludibacteraceae bacterium]